MTAHDESRDPSREGPGPEYDGMDALMAALLDEPLPEPARRDPEFLAERDAAVADLAVLRERLTAIGDALAGPPGAGPAGSGETAARPDTGAADAAPRPPADPASGSRDTPAPSAGPLPRPGDGRGNDGGDRPDTGAAPGRDPAPRLPGASPGRGGARPRTAGGTRGPHRRRTAKAVLGGLVAAAAAGLVLGTGWLVTQGGGADGSTAQGAAADSKEAGGVAFGSPRYLACARLVAEGTVTAVERVPGAAGVERVTLRADRYYKGEGEVTFLRDTAGASPLRPGDRVLVGLPSGGEHPDAVVVGEPDIAPERARITASLPASRTLTCG
ncbi:hypothetical protein [Streptomyces pilosus]|uniref:Uncharacterized protein n=1 Tax=Streptomyces pilosus TaxID=28893 RepID=A0A918BF42_9ACTN|nr:hypothetical protein [Streptomyces pilosus]GGQ64273.1 hypothetical protein GCM10010280_08520 [Streptomyces pilosus]